MSHSREDFPLGVRVRDTQSGELGIIEEYRTDGIPLVRWDYGNLLRASLEDLEVAWNTNTLS